MPTPPPLTAKTIAARLHPLHSSSPQVQSILTALPEPIINVARATHNGQKIYLALTQEDIHGLSAPIASQQIFQHHLRDIKSLHLTLNGFRLKLHAGPILEAETPFCDTFCISLAKHLHKKPITHSLFLHPAQEAKKVSIAAIACTAMLAGLYAYLKNNPTTYEDPEPQVTLNQIASACNSAVQAQLKAPSTARFQPQAERKPAIQLSGDHVWVSWADSQSPSGAILRTYFECTYTPTSQAKIQFINPAADSQ
jgi:hypothetical protein